MIKVIHVITRLDLGGAQRNTLYTCRHLDPGGFECLLAAGPGGMLDAELESLGPARRVLLPSLVREISPLKDLAALWGLWRLFRSERPDVVHTHSSKAGVLGRVAARLAGVRAVVHTYHGFGFHDFMPPRRKALYVRIERFCCSLADRIVFVSHANRDYAQAHGLVASERQVLIRSGIRIGDHPAAVKDRPALLASLGLAGKKLLVSSIGNLKPQKNPGGFLALAEALRARFPDAGFAFLGDGPLREGLERELAAAGLRGSVSLPGWRRDAAEVLAASDVFVLTSLWEGLPRALVEAMATGVPCVCYATDGVKDIVREGENGYMVQINDERGMAQRVGELLADPGLRSRVGAAARASVSSEFDIDLMVRRQEELYRELAGSPSSMR